MKIPPTINMIPLNVIGLHHLKCDPNKAPQIGVTVSNANDVMKYPVPRYILEGMIDHHFVDKIL